MKNLYQEYTAIKETIILNKSSEIDNLITKAKSPYAILSKKKEAELKEFYQIQSELTTLSLHRFFIEVEDLQNSDSAITEKMAFLQCLGDLNADQQKIITLLGRYSASKEIILIIEAKWKDDEQVSQIKKIHWGGSEQTEFVQLIYSMIESGYIIDKDRIGKYETVKRFADFFNFKLNKNWKDDLSSSIHDRNTDYKPEIFKKLMTGWIIYRDNRLDNKKRE